MSKGSTLLKFKDVSLSLQVATYRSWSVREWVSGYMQKFGNQVPQTRNFQVLDKISFTIKRGDRVGIVGVNGSGKSTLCRLMSGIYSPDSGMISCESSVRAVLDTHISIFPDLTGRENANLISHFLFPDTPKRSEWVLDALAWSELGDFIDVPMRVYSKGMQARLLLSLISVNPSELLILDEVFDGADQFFSKKTVPRVLEMIRDSGAVVFVSHNENQVREVCNRILVLNGGKLVFDGDVEAGLKIYKKG